MVARARKAAVLLSDLQLHSPPVALDSMHPASGRSLGDGGLAGVLHTRV